MTAAMKSSPNRRIHLFPIKKALKRTFSHPGRNFAATCTPARLIAGDDESFCRQ
jgi:hypothetical protein